MKWPVDRKVTIELKDEAKKIRDDIKKKISSSINKVLLYNSEVANNDIKEMYSILNSLKNLILEFSDRFKYKKREKNIIDFNDIEHFALELLVKKDDKGNLISTEIANEYKEKFEEIAIDEYQDSNLVQEYILRSISKGNNIFMVGDVKQSIYKFRQARPELFLEKYEKYSIDKEQGRDLKIKLFKNFRSRQNILDFTNLVFDNIMTKEIGDILYDKDEYLNMGANYEPPENIKSVYASKSIEKNESDEPILENSVIEAKYVANRINELLNNPDYVVYDKKIGYRKITYKDIVILLRATSTLAPIYEKEITALNIPVFSDTSSEFLDSIEVQTILSVLKIIDNPTQDIPFVSVLRSSIGGFTDDELVKIRLCNKESNFYEAFISARIQCEENLKLKIENFLEELKSWQNKVNEKPLDELIWNIYMETNYYNYVRLNAKWRIKKSKFKDAF